MRLRRGLAAPARLGHRVGTGRIDRRPLAIHAPPSALDHLRNLAFVLLYLPVELGDPLPARGYPLGVIVVRGGPELELLAITRLVQRADLVPKSDLLTRRLRPGPGEDASEAEPRSGAVDEANEGTGDGARRPAASRVDRQDQQHSAEAERNDPGRPLFRAEHEEDPGDHASAAEDESHGRGHHAEDPRLRRADLDRRGSVLA